MVGCGGVGVAGEVREQLGLKFGMVLPHLNERQRRLLLAAEARLLGHGGVRAVAEIAGVSETTVRKGIFELEAARTLSRADVCAGWAAAASRPYSWIRIFCRRCWRCRTAALRTRQHPAGCVTPRRRRSPKAARITRRQILGGLINEYSQLA